MRRSAALKRLRSEAAARRRRLINPQTMMLGQEPRQTTSNLGHLNKPSIQALIHGLNRHYYSIAISYRKNELEERMLMNLQKKAWTAGLMLKCAARARHRRHRGLPHADEHAEEGLDGRAHAQVRGPGPHQPSRLLHADEHAEEGLDGRAHAQVRGAGLPRRHASCMPMNLQKKAWMAGLMLKCAARARPRPLPRPLRGARAARQRARLPGSAACAALHGDATAACVRVPHFWGAVLQSA